MPVLPSSDRGTTGGSRLMFATSYDEAKASIDAGYVYHLLESVEKVGPHGYIHGWIKSRGR